MNKSREKRTQFRHAARKQLLDALDSTYFTVHNFTASFDSPAETREMARIVFNLKPDYHFVILKHDGYNKEYLTQECPGVELDNEQAYARENFESCLRGVVQWAARIHEDYRQAMPFYKEFDDLRNVLEEELHKHVSDPDAHFSKEEVANLQAKLDELASKFEELERKHSITEEQLQTVKAQLSELSVDLQYFPKQAWYKTAANKIISMLGKFAASKEGRELVASTTMALMSHDSAPGTPSKKAP